MFALCATKIPNQIPNQIPYQISNKIPYQIFNQIPNQIKVGHYHSWVIDEATLPSCLEVTSKNEDGIIMSIRHKKYDLKGVQFHPESILTQHGLLMIKNWIFS